MQDQELTGWFELSDQKPWEPGVYEVNSFLGGEVYSYWDGEKFKYIDRTKDAAFEGRYSKTCRLESEIKWRGLASDPNANPKPNRSGNPKVTRYVVIDVMKGEPVASFHTRDAAVDYAERMAWPRIKRVRHRSPE